jgi:HPr kinase/phosphorylase
MEFAYLSTVDEQTRRERLEKLFSQNLPALIITRDLPYFAEMLEFAKQYEMPLLRSKESTSNFMSGLIAFLNLNLAPRITRHGVLIEIYGEGVFITGESGVGKSETAIELVKRGHRLVADDAVEIKKVSNISLVGSSPDNIRHFLELRGIGIINAFWYGCCKAYRKNRPYC